MGATLSQSLWENTICSISHNT